MAKLDEESVSFLPDTENAENGGQWGQWLIKTQKMPICGAIALGELSDKLGTKSPLPEMVFGDNFLELFHKPTSTKFRFDTEDGLRGWSQAKAPAFHVSCAREWKSKATTPKDAVTMEYDWTYSVLSPGVLEEGSAGTPHETDETINVALLQRPDPILFYRELDLFEDELHDHGHASYSIRIRVMPSCFLVLVRFFLRVDHVLLRVVDTRVYYEIGKKGVLREWQVREDPWEDYARKHPENPQAPYADPNEVFSNLTVREVKRISVPLV